LRPNSFSPEKSKRTHRLPVKYKKSGEGARQSSNRGFQPRLTVGKARLWASGRTPGGGVVLLKKKREIWEGEDHHFEDLAEKKERDWTTTPWGRMAWGGREKRGGDRSVAKMKQEPTALKEEFEGPWGKRAVGRGRYKKRSLRLKETLKCQASAWGDPLAHRKGERPPSDPKEEI